MRKIILLFLIITVALFNNVIGSAEGPKNYLKGKFYSSVKNHFLIATEKMTDSRFSKTVIIMLESDENGAWGLAINKRLGTMPIALLIDPSLNTSEEREELFKLNVPIFWGGPVEVDKKALSDLKGKRKVGQSVDGLGGFILEAADGSVSYDMRFDTMLDSAWADSLSEINKILFE